MKNKLINKLNKKDREEMLSRIKKEKDKKFTSIGLVYINILFRYVILLAVAIPLWFIAFEQNHINLLLSGLNLFTSIGKLLVYFIFFGFILDYIVFFVRRIRMIKIKKEYFDVVPKRK